MHRSSSGTESITAGIWYPQPHQERLSESEVRHERHIIQINDKHTAGITSCLFAHVELKLTRVVSGRTQC